MSPSCDPFGHHSFICKTATETADHNLARCILPKKEVVDLHVLMLLTTRSTQNCLYTIEFQKRGFPDAERKIAPIQLVLHTFSILAVSIYSELDKIVKKKLSTQIKIKFG